MESITSPGHDDFAAASHSWSRLPQDVVMRVLARLPLPHLLRARTVCKEWSLLTSTPEFRSVYDGQSRQPYFPVMMWRGGMITPDVASDAEPWDVLFGYDYATGEWHKLPPLDFLPVAAAQGLVCFAIGASRYVVYNLVARTCEELPQTPHKWMWISSLHILVDRCTASYRLIVLGMSVPQFGLNSELRKSVVIYESTTKAWRFRDSPQLSHTYTHGTFGSAVCGDAMYCGVWLSGALGVVAYDIPTDAWLEGMCAIPPPPDDGGGYRMIQVVGCGDAIYMVLARGYEGVGSTGVVSSLNILKLEATTDRSEQLESSLQGRRVWRLVTCLCDELLEDLQREWLDADDSDAIVCVGYGSRICLSAGTGLILQCDIETGCWSRLPPCPQLCNLAVESGVAPFHFPMELHLSSRV